MVQGKHKNVQNFHVSFFTSSFEIREFYLQCLNLVILRNIIV